MNEIEVIWKFLDNLDEYVYATDIETDELVYMNRKLLEVYGLQSIDDVKGMKCYEVLQKSSVPCGMCNNDRLCAGKFVEWRYYNPVIDKYMMLKDTLVEDPVTNKKYRIEISIDISEERSQDKMIQKYRDMESFVNEALKDALSVESPDETIRIILEYLGKVLNGERTYIFEKNRDGRDDNTYEWTAPGVPPEIDNLQNLPPEICENWYHIFEEGKYVQIPDIEEMRLSDPFQYENLKRQKIHSIVAMPIYDAEKVIAFYGVDNPPAFSLEYTSDMLQIMGSFLKSCIRRRNLMRRLEDLSYKDALTQLGNRFAMEKYVRQIYPEQSVGVVYCDVTGLKGVNDTLGHKAGDDLILEPVHVWSKCLAITAYSVSGEMSCLYCARRSIRTRWRNA